MGQLLPSATTIGLVTSRLSGGERAAAPLASIEVFMVRNCAVLSMIVFLFLGAMLLGDGLTSLA